MEPVESRLYQLLALVFLFACSTGSSFVPARSHSFKISTASVFTSSDLDILLSKSLSEPSLFHAKSICKATDSHSFF